MNELTKEIIFKIWSEWPDIEERYHDNMGLILHTHLLKLEVPIIEFKFPEDHSELINNWVTQWKSEFPEIKH